MNAETPHEGGPPQIFTLAGEHSLPILESLCKHQLRQSELTGHKFRDSELLVAGQIARRLGAVMQATRSRNYHAEYLARKERASARGLSTTQARGHGGGVRAAQASLRTKKGLAEATSAQLEFRDRELAALSGLRSGEHANPAEAEKAKGLPRGSLRRDMPTAFDSRGRVKTGDHEGAVMSVASTEGVVHIIVTGSRNRQLVGQHWAAIRGVLKDQLDSSALKPFAGKKVSGYELETDINRLRVFEDNGLIVGSPYPTVRPTR